MAITIDIVDNAQFDHGVQGSNLTRTAHVYGLDAGFSSGDPSVLFRALAAAGIPQWYSLHPSNPNYVCNRHNIRPLDDSSCEVVINYVTGPGQPPGSTWLVTETTSPMQVTTQIHPDSKDVMTITGAVAGGVQIKTDVCTFSYDISVRRLTFEGWVSRTAVPGNSTPTQPANTDIYAQTVNSVNQAAWRGYPVGYWRFHEWSDLTQDRGFSYTIRASFITKMIEDWSQYYCLRDPNNGKILAAKAADIAALKNAVYQYGWTAKPFITKAGLYDLADFTSLFGS